MIRNTINRKLPAVLQFYAIGKTKRIIKVSFKYNFAATSFQSSILDNSNKFCGPLAEYCFIFSKNQVYSLTAILWIVKKQFTKQLKVRYHYYSNNCRDRVVSVTVEDHMSANSISQYKHNQNAQEVSHICHLKSVEKTKDTKFIQGKCALFKRL